VGLELWVNLVSPFRGMTGSAGECLRT
jgi:hypothetical protein